MDMSTDVMYGEPCNPKPQMLARRQPPSLKPFQGFGVSDTQIMDKSCVYQGKGICKSFPFLLTSSLDLPAQRFGPDNLSCTAPQSAKVYFPFSIYCFLPFSLSLSFVVVPGHSSLRTLSRAKTPSI